VTWRTTYAAWIATCERGLGKVHLDLFLVAILVTGVVASFLPVRGVGAGVLDGATKLAIFLLFFLYGARLKPREALQGLTHWRLHLVILGFTFVLFPLAGIGLRILTGPVIAPALYPGLLYLTLVPSTIQSSIAFTSIARGNVAGAIVAASASNLVGVFLTPLLAIALLSTSGTLRIGWGSLGGIALQILLPFLLGQALRRWIGDWVLRHGGPLKVVDRGTIVLVVYAAFSQGRREHMWSQVTIAQLLVLIAVCLALLAFFLVVTWWVPGRLGFGRADRIAIQFCGTKKSLASGLPMAQVLFAGSPIGLLVLPLVVFHQAQLMVCSVLASRYGRQATP